MKRMKIPGDIAAVFLFLSLTCTIAHADGEVEQKFTLKPGWNAVFLEVRPEPRDPATVFADLPAGSSVWTWLSRESSVEFIQDPSEDLWGQPNWHVYFNVDGREQSGVVADEGLDYFLKGLGRLSKSFERSLSTLLRKSQQVGR